MPTALACAAVHALRRGARPLARRLRRRLRHARGWVPHRWDPRGRAWPPVHVTLELTYLCGLRCEMCSLVHGDMVSRAGQARRSEDMAERWVSPSELTSAEYLELIDRMAAAGVRSITLTGGEPTLRPDLVEIVRAIRGRGMHLYLISNGQASVALYRRLVQAGLDGICISLDGPPSVHDRIRGRSGAHARAVRALQALLEERRGRSRPLDVDVSCAVSSSNHEVLEQVVATCRALDVDSLQFGLLHFTTEERERRTRDLMPGEVRGLKRSVLPDRLRRIDPESLDRRLRALASDTRRPRVRIFPDLRGEALGAHFAGRLDPRGAACLHAWLDARVDPWGRMVPCWIDVPMGNVREHDFLELWNGPRYRGFRRRLRTHGTLAKCSTCPALAEQLSS